MILLADECVIEPIVKLFIAYEDSKYQLQSQTKQEIVTVAGRYGRGTPDETWMLDAATWNPKPIIISGDARALNKHEARRDIVKRCGFVWFGLAEGWMNTEFEVLAWKAIKVWPAIVKTAQKANPPTVYLVRLRNEDVVDVTGSIYR